MYQKDRFGRWVRAAGIDLFADPTLGSRSVLEQAAGVNQAFDPGMSFGTASAPPKPSALSSGDLESVSVDVGNVQLSPTEVSQIASSPDTGTGGPDWKTIALWGAGGLLLWWLLSNRR